MARYSHVDSLFSELLDAESDPEPTTNVAEEQNFYNSFLKEIAFSNETSVRNFLFTGEPFHSTYEISIILCNHIHKKMPSMNFLDERYTPELIEFLKANGEMMYRNIHQQNKDYCYIFMYKNIFIYFTYMPSKKEINSIGIVHPIDLAPPIEDLEPYHKPREKQTRKIGIIKPSKYGLTVSRIKLESQYEFSFDHYNDDFSAFFDNLTGKLSEKKPGLFLFHGEPGTGKSSAIRHLIASVDRDFIFIPPQMIDQLSTPEFADIITDTNKGSVLILEDAEKALMKRDSEDGFSNSTLVSSILNLTDGLYADLGNIAILATYNCSRNLIDSALLRKGRMKAEYKFDKLNKIKAQALMKKLKHNVDVTEDMILADIFNYEDQYTNVEGSRDKAAIGFGRPGF